MSEPAPVEASKEKIDEFSATWIFIERWVKDDLAKSREENDSSKKDDVQTALLRGRIKLLKELLELPLPPKRDRQRLSRPPDEQTEY